MVNSARSSGLVGCLLLSACGSMGGSGLVATAEDAALQPGAYEISRSESGTRDGKQVSARTVRHDVAVIPKEQAARWPKMYVEAAAERLVSGVGDCTVTPGTKTGNQTIGKVRCSGESRGDPVDLVAEYETLRGTDKFEFRIRGSEKTGGAEKHVFDFDYGYNGRMLTKEELEKNGASRLAKSANL